MSNFDMKIISDPLFFHDNRLKAHSDHLLFATEEERSAGKTSLRKCLNGMWRFSYASNSKELAEDFYKEDYDCSGWTFIKVPAHIQMEGYDAPHYTNTTYPWEGKEWIVPGEIPTQFNPVASYITTFEVPKEWEGDGIRISFQGVESGFALWLNGHYVGYSENSFDPADFDLSSYIKEGTNKLAVRVWKWTASSWCEDQDFFRFSGIYRDVFLYPVKSVHVQDVKIKANVAEDLKSGELSLTLDCLGEGSAYVSLYSPKSGVMYPTTADLKDRWVLYTEETAVKKGKNSLTIAVPDVKLWSAEKPNLYVLIAELRDKDGKVTEIISEFVGFRKFVMKDGLMMLNDKRIVFKGVNRHEFSAYRGRVPAFDEIYTDIVTMKQNNINAIRTSHYPDASHVYEDGEWKYGIYSMCDVFGLYMIAENNLESHGTMEAFERGHVERDYLVPDCKDEWAPMLLDRITSCYERDKNHPAIIIWSVGNESCGGTVIERMADRFRELDSDRLVHYEGLFHDRSYPRSSDMESQMYPKVADIEQFLRENKDKPFICCEYTHAMGNSCGGMHHYTELAYSEPRYQGGFIWDYIDQSIAKKDRFGNQFFAYGGDFGDRPTDAEFSGNGIVYGNRMPSPKMQDVKFNYQNIVITIGEDDFTVENRNLFVNTDEYDCKVSLLENGVSVLTLELETEVAPLSKGTYKLPLKLRSELTRMQENDDSEATVLVSYTLAEDTLWAKAGHEVAFGQKVFKKEYKSYSCDTPVVYVRGNNNIGVRGENFNVIFARMSVGMVSYVYQGRELLNAVPKPNFWRAPTNNDDGNMMPQRHSQWKIASMYGNTRCDSRFEDVSPKIEQTDKTVKITYLFKLPTTPRAEVEVSYEVFGDGTVEMHMTYDPVEGLPDMPEFGMLFKVDAEYENVKWYGYGPEETYSDRMEGAKLGIYENKVVDNMAGYLVPQECGNKCGVRKAQITDNNGFGLLFEGDEMSFSALPYTPHELENATHVYELPPVHNTVIRVAKAQLGVGGDDSWGAPVLPQYHLDVTKKMEFSFRFRGIC